MDRLMPEISRRRFLQGLSTAAAMAIAQPAGVAFGGEAIRLAPEHVAAVNRRRRIVVQYDAYNAFGTDMDTWLKYRFAYIDQPDNQIDAVWWDIGPLQPETYPNPPGVSPVQAWLDQGIDPIGRLVDETRRRNLECFWNHRISEVDLSPTGLGAAWKSEPHPFKKAHPDWVLKTWWPHGLWNLAVPEVREYTLSVLEQLINKYPLDGFQLDFARHIPCLPPGRQWELRGHVTEMVRMVRQMTMEAAVRRGRPILLAARVPRSLKGCRADGFDIEAWAAENLVDLLTLGSRSLDVDVAGYRRAVGGRNIKLQPCFDDHHAADGYRFAPIEVLRGTFANWWQQGADSVVTFNWSNAPPDTARKLGGEVGPTTHGEAYREVGSPKTLVAKDKTFVVERRGGYPWAEGYFNQNADAPLPLPLANDGAPTAMVLRISDDLKTPAAPVRHLFLRLILFGAGQEVQMEVKLNNEPLVEAVRDAAWKDPQIFSPKPQPASGGSGDYQINPAQKLLRLDYQIDPQHCLVGENRVELRLREPCPQPVIVEKLEAHLTYAP